VIRVGLHCTSTSRTDGQTDAQLVVAMPRYAQHRR